MKIVNLKSLMTALLVSVFSTTAYASGNCDVYVADSDELAVALQGIDPNPCPGMVTQPGDTICIAAGTYIPTADTAYDPIDERTRSFRVLVDDLTIKGAGMDATIFPTSALFAKDELVFALKSMT